MDILKQETGSTIVEALVGLTILGLVVSLAFSFMIRLYACHGLTNKLEAFRMADEEITNSLNRRITSDTVYSNRGGSLLLERNIEKEELMNKIFVCVKSKNSEKTIVSLSANFVAQRK